MTITGSTFCEDPLARYDTPLLASAELQSQLRRSGYLVLPDVIPQAAIDELVRMGNDFVERLDEPFGDLFLAAGRIENAALREEVTDAAGNVLRDYLEPLFVSGSEVLGAAFQVKPPSDQSELNPHQDSSLLDEATQLGAYCWVPLVDVDELNGWLTVVPGSHRLGNVQRTLNVPWQFEGQEDVFRNHGVGLKMAAGSVAIFDAALVHGSPPNRSNEIRFALNNFAKPKNAPMVHFFADDETTEGFVEAWEIDTSFFLEENIMERPSGRYRSLGERPHVRVSLDDEELDEVLKRCAKAATETSSDTRGCR